MAEVFNEDISIPEYLKDFTILCVDDNKTTQLIYESLLEGKVKNILCADDGQKGYEKFLNEDVDIIITDYDMPHLDGLAMSEKIREKDKHIPIILISAIEKLDVITTALNLQINNFVKKPINQDDLLSTLYTVSKLIIASNYLEKQNQKKLTLLQEKEKYNSYQEDLAFAKELNILRNDFYYQMIDDTHISLVDFLYQPLDVISGDAYTARRIDENRTFYLIVDGMGKGLSASLTAMTMTSFINHLIDRMLEHDSFSLHILIKESMDYIRPILLDEEALAIDYIVFDTAYDKIEYSKFAMPVFLMQDRHENLIRIKSNNPPLSKWQSDYKVDEYSIVGVDKFLFYSDGIVENITIHDDRVYADFIEDDFKESFTREDLKNHFFEKIDESEDDITLIFINRLPLKDNLMHEKIFSTSLESVDSASEWYAALWQEFTQNIKTSYQASLVFTELYMNAYEHGNLAINAHVKHQLLDDDIYFKTLKEKELLCSKNIEVKVSKINYRSAVYIVTQITDEGDGFDTQSLSQIFRNSKNFNGRGVFVSRKNSLGIYYNSKGNSVLYLNKI